MTMHSPLTVQTSIQASPATCWKLWNNPADILLFNNPFDNWHTATVTIDLKEGGRFFYRMETKDGSEGFDFAGTYGTIIINEKIESMGNDGRKTTVLFEATGNDTLVSEIFEPDATTRWIFKEVFARPFWTILKSMQKKIMIDNYLYV